MSMTPENIERAARIFDAARRDNYFVDEIPPELGLDNLEDAARVPSEWLRFRAKGWWVSSSGRPVPRCRRT